LLRARADPARGSMRDGSLLWLVSSGAAIAFVHTVLGPDHYLPFVAMGRALSWSRTRLALVTLLCGLGHILSSIVLGLAGIALGFGITRLHAWDSTRGDWAAYALAACGLVYAAWGVVHARRRRSHVHRHWHHDGTAHSHAHVHEGAHLHAHLEDGRGQRWHGAAPLMLFTVFLLGPCEPLVPIFMYATVVDWPTTALVAAVFGATTLATMLAIVLALDRGLGQIRLPALEPYGHALAGATIALCGAAMITLGL
jgi:uncharacterized membrane protein YuzA (DUF378 family)